MSKQASPSARSELRASARLLDVAGAADFLGTTDRHVRRLVAERRVPFTKLGDGRSARLRFRADRLAQWVDEHSFEPEAGA